LIKHLGELLMVQYIYFVKCPNCEDEHFDFFDEAKAFALGCLGDKPIITQTEVCRNDFGECTDSSDLGTVWSWEDEVELTNEPVAIEFTKDDLVPYNVNEDPEFATIDNSVDFEVDESEFNSNTTIDRVPDNFRKPVPANMTIEQLVEEMEENEDMVECVCCQELYPKADCKYDEKHGWICPDCIDKVVECTWCEELYDRDECRYEVNLGWLCDRCEAAIKSRGETLTFREGSYWDLLDESTDLKETGLSDIAAAYGEQNGVRYTSRDLRDYTGIDEPFGDEDDALVTRRELYKDYNLIRRSKNRQVRNTQQPQRQQQPQSKQSDVDEIE
jgi:hypothetical protein